MGSGQPAPLRDSLALLRQSGCDKVAGAALVVTNNGFLKTDQEGGRVLADGSATAPIRVASALTGLT